jgi:hypothetical protein
MWDIPKHNDVRIVKKFAFLPIHCVNNVGIWWQWYWEEQLYIKTKWVNDTTIVKDRWGKNMHDYKQLESPIRYHIPVFPEKAYYSIEI